MLVYLQLPDDIPIGILKVFQEDRHVSGSDPILFILCGLNLIHCSYRLLVSLETELWIDSLGVPRNH